MSKRVTAVRRKPTARASNHAAPKKKSSKRTASKSPAKKSAPRKTAARTAKKAARQKPVARKKKQAKATARAKKIVKKVKAKPTKIAKKIVAKGQPARVHAGKNAARGVANAKPPRGVANAKPPRGVASAKPPRGVASAKPARGLTNINPARRQEAAAARSSGPPTPRSITPPPSVDTAQPAKVRMRAPAKIVIRAAYVSPAQRVLEAQAAAQSRARRVQASREESAARAEVSPASELAPVVETSAVSSEPRTSAAFVRRGRLGPRDPNASPNSEPQSSTLSTAEAFDREWKLIASAAQKASLTLERELVQSWLEPWLAGKDTLALVRSAQNSSEAYFVAAHALGRKFIVVQRSESIAEEVANRFSRLGMNVHALSASGIDQKAILSRFSSGASGALIVPLAAFDNDELFSELQQLKANGLVAEEAQRVSELSFDFDIAYDRLPTIITRLGRPPTLAVLRSAPPSVRTDLPHRLGLRSSQRVDLQPLPETIALEVPVVDIPHRGGTLLERVGQSAHPITVLCAAVEEVDEILEVFARASVAARASWALSNQVHSPVVAAGPSVTVGVSGMTSNRDPAPRTLIHYRAPSSLEQYTRDLGRLNTKDGDASAIVLAALEDEPPMRQWLERQRPRPEDLLQVATVLNQHAGPGKMALVDTLSASVGVGRAKLESLLSLLASAGWVEHKLDWVRVPDNCADLLDRARALAARLRSLRERDHQRMRSVSAYVIGRNCRHESMRRHFGTAAQRPCGLCDNCRTKAAHLAANDVTSQPEATEPASS